MGKINVEAVRGRSLQKISIPSLLEELRKKRNYSIVAHGMEPVDRDDAGNCMAAMRVLLAHLLPAAGNVMEDYPLQEAKIFVVLDSLRQSFCH